MTICQSARALLDQLERDPGAWPVFVATLGGIVPAGHRLACARLECWHVSTAPVPSAMELHAAAREVAERSGHIGSVPSRRTMVEIARAHGLAVLDGRRDSWET